MKQCPKCKKYAVVYDEYFKTDRCLMVDCGWDNRFEPKEGFK